jgi:hypothetical protein
MLKPGHKSGRTLARPAAARALVPVVPGLAASDPCGHYVDHQPVDTRLVMAGQALAVAHTCGAS